MRPRIKGIGKWRVDGEDMMLTRDTPWNNFINVELELLISRHGQHDLFYCDTFSSFFSNATSRTYLFSVFSLPLSDLTTAFSLCLIHDCDKINVGTVLWTVK